MKEPETKMEQLKSKLELKNKLGDKLELGDKLDDLGIDAPSMDIKEYIRVLKLARKPTREEFMMIGKISISGIFLIGMMGFIIYALLTEIPSML